MTNSQSNMRSQPTSSIPAMNGLKRSVPMPGTNDPFVQQPSSKYSHGRNTAVQSDAKRVPLSRRAGEFPDKPTTSSHHASQNVRGMSLRDTVSQPIVKHRRF